MKNKFAFSLAETLTTLMLIGVVAAVTIPVLNANVEKQKKISILKRLYSSFSINIQTVLNEANCSSISCLRAYSNDGIVNQTQNDIVIEKTDEKTGKTFKEKEFHQIEGHVFANPKYFNVLSQAGCKECLTETSVVPDGDAKDYTPYRLNNGTVMALYNYKGNCTQSDKVTDRDVCGIVLFDVNALKGPNAPGKDRFAYYIADEEFDGSYLIPVGYNAYKGVNSFVGDEGCSTAGDNRGYNCTAKIMLDKWKINY